MEMDWKDVVPKRKTGQRALFVFPFPCLIPAAWDAVALLSSGTCHSPSFSCSWVSCHSAGSELLKAAVPRPLAAALPWPRPSGAAVERSFYFGNILLFGLSVKSLFSLFLQTFSYADFYLRCHSTRLFWNLPLYELLHNRSFQGSQPPSCRCFKDGQPLQTAGVCTPVSSFPHSMQAQCVCLVPGLAASTYALWPGPNIARFWGESWEN